MPKSSSNKKNDINNLFINIEQNKDYSFSIYQKLENSINTALNAKDYNLLLEWIPYLESPNLIHTAKTRKIYLLLQLQKIESSNTSEHYLSTVHSLNELEEQYTKTVFALRRLEFSFSNESTIEASNYLNTLSFSIYAAQLFIFHEYFENYKSLYENLYRIFKPKWSNENKISWLESSFSYDASDYMYIELTSLYMDINEYTLAYKTLNKISNPNTEIIQLVNTLKDIINHE